MLFYWPTSDLINVIPVAKQLRESLPLQSLTEAANQCWSQTKCPAEPLLYCGVTLADRKTVVLAECGIVISVYSH